MRKSKQTPETIAAAAHKASTRAMSTPPRVCYVNRLTINNPVCQVTVDTSLCGTAGRTNIDVLTSDKDAVTCKPCRVLLGLDKKPSAPRKKKTPAKRKKP